MRIDELLSQTNEITPEKYSTLKAQKVFLIEYREQSGWDFSDLETLTEAQARRYLDLFHRLQAFENENNIRKPIREVIISHNQEPAWPKELQRYKTPFIFEAYLMHKFNLQSRSYAN
ncbi:hypothetical protein [Gracilimonas tropica]|uniref:hypothetical protein n=1 Tax=Gracilimonas tropica TaxID=454600 RepID=UPI000373097F|nr:hypothetical protein [Gracilimonas tropica]